MAKKFFYNKVYNTKRTIINAIIIGVCIIGIIICFVITSNFQGESHNNNTSNLSIKSEATVEINEEFSNEIFFSKIENVNLEDIEIKYPLNYDISKIGKYNVTIVINEKNYSTIAAGTAYSVNDFVEKCEDNSKIECNLSFYTDGLDEDGNSIDYSKYKDEGTYSIKISAIDEAGNKTIKETKLTIGNTENISGNENNSDNDANTSNNTCKYGDNTFDTKNYLLASDITSNNCAVSLSSYKDETMTKEINKMMDVETTKIKKDVEALNLTGTLALNRKVTAIINTSGNGIVGYELKMTVTITNNDSVETVAEYKVNSNGKRVFITNPYKLAS